MGIGNMTYKTKIRTVAAVKNVAQKPSQATHYILLKVL